MTTVCWTQNPNPVRLRFVILLAFAFVALHSNGLFQEQALAQKRAEGPKATFAAALISVADASDQRLAELKLSGMGTVVLKLETADKSGKSAVREVIRRANRAGLSFAYWIEVARCQELADQNPQWMASLQTHDEWRRLFPNFPEPGPDQVVKTYPWVPILARQPFDAQLDRVSALLADLPAGEQIFLNDLQGAPSACGCGNDLCRWTSDYGKKRTTVPLGDAAAAKFIAAVKKFAPASEVIPVWTTECEEHDGHPDGLCAGVGCFKGICWKAYTKQLMPVAQSTGRIAVLATYKQFHRDDPLYGEAKGSWVGFAIQLFETMPPKHNGQAIPASRIVAVLQGWDVTTDEIAAQQRRAVQAGACGFVVALDKIEQGWSPKIIRWK